MGSLSSGSTAITEGLLIGTATKIARRNLRAYDPRTANWEAMKFRSSWEVIQAFGDATISGIVAPFCNPHLLRDTRIFDWHRNTTTEHNQAGSPNPHNG